MNVCCRRHRPPCYAGRADWLCTDRVTAEGVLVLVLANTNGSLSQGYLLPTPAPAPNSYQHRIAVVGTGGIELVVDTAVAQINNWLYDKT